MGKDWRTPRHRHLIGTLTLPDRNDRHVLAAAIAARVSVIVTYNLQDFPETALGPFGISALHPDVFLCSLLEQAPDDFIESVHAHRTALRHPPKSPADYLGALDACGLPRLSEALALHEDRI